MPTLKRPRDGLSSPKPDVPRKIAPHSVILQIGFRRRKPDGRSLKIKIAKSARLDVEVPVQCRSVRGDESKGNG